MAQKHLAIHRLSICETFNLIIVQKYLFFVKKGNECWKEKDLRGRTQRSWRKIPEDGVRGEIVSAKFEMKRGLDVMFTLRRLPVVDLATFRAWRWLFGALPWILSCPLLAKYFLVFFSHSSFRTRFREFGFDQVLPQCLPCRTWINLIAHFDQVCTLMFFRTGCPKSILADQRTSGS